jgi:hypothetical protein
VGGVSRGAAEVLASLQRAGVRAGQIRFTRNRRVMASLGADGETLRIHECFAQAPDTVLDALGSLFDLSPGPKRSAAGKLVHAFLREQLQHPRKPRARSVSAADRAIIDRLREEFDHVNSSHFSGILPAIAIYLSGRMRRRNGHFSPDPLEIVISRRLCVEAAAGEAERTLRHEMIHLWQHVSGTRIGHGTDFRDWARRLGIHPRATRPVRWGDDR